MTMPKFAIEYHGVIENREGREVTFPPQKKLSEALPVLISACEQRGIEAWDWRLDEVEVHRRDWCGKVSFGKIKTRRSSVAGFEELNIDFDRGDE
jgi:hypothetical protein